MTPGQPGTYYCSLPLTLNIRRLEKEIFGHKNIEIEQCDYSLW